MAETQVIVRQADGTARVVEAANGGVVVLNPDEQLVVAAAPDQVEVKAEDQGTVVVQLEDVGEFTVELVAQASANDVMSLESSVFRTQPVIVVEAESAVLSDDTLAREALGVHQASVVNTDFLDRDTGADFGMTELIDAGSFSALLGEGLTGRKIDSDIESEGLGWYRHSFQNEAPLVIGSVDLGEVDEDTSLLVTAAQLLATAFDADGDELFVTGLTVTEGSGIFTDNGDGTWTFTPDADWNGNVTFSYQISDGYSSTAGTAVLTVNPVNDAPTSDAVTLPSINEDTSTTITAAQLLGHAFDVDGDPLSVTGLTLSEPAAGTLIDNGDGTWTFTPAAEWSGNVTFSYQISDGALSTTGAAALAVNLVNDAPMITLNTTLLVDDDATESLMGSLLSTDADDAAANLEYLVTQAPIHGALFLNGVEITDFSRPVFTQADIDNGRVSFRFDTPQPGDETQVIEDDSFVFSVTDGVNTTGPATFLIHNTTVQVWGTSGADDLTAAANFDRADTIFHVYGFGGDDTLRGGSGGDILDGGQGGDTVEYSASTSAVDVDLTRATQIGGHAEGDSLTGIENLVGSNFNDILTGDANNNLLDGGADNDTLSSGAGNDTLIGGAGADSMDGGTGSDMGDYSGGASWVQVNLTLATAQVGGGADNDALGDILAGIENLTGTNDTAHGDVLTGNTLANLLIGLDGDDTLIGGSGNDTLIGGVGADSMDGGANTDMADYSASATWVNVDLNLATAQTGGGAGNHALGDTLVSIERLIGTNDTIHGDVLTGNGVSNWLSSLDGDDTINGGGFYDTIYGGAGNDVIDGGTHEDSIFGGAGNDTIYGGTGIDSIWGGSGDDYLEGYYSAGMDDDQDLLIGGTGNDTLDGSHSSAWDTLIGGMGADRIIGNGIRTEVSYELTGYGDFDVSYQGVYLDLNIQDGVTAQTGKPGGDDATGDILTGIVNAVGSNGADTLIGNDQANEMYGVDADDLMIGGAGNDSLWGVNNNDTLEGGLGADFLWGGMDYDIASYANAASGVNVSLEIQLGPTQSGAGEENGDELWYMDGLWGSEFNDTLTGRSTDDPQYMSIHNLIEGRGGDDLISGLAGNDTLDGGAGDDTLIGGLGNDLLIGGEGDDLIQAGAGDTVQGGVDFDALRSEDVQLDVTSSTTMTGIERIDLSGVGESLLVQGDAIVSNGVLDPIGDGAHALIVTGDAGDLVDLSGDTWNWTLAAQDADIGDGRTYTVYEATGVGGTVRLYVQSELAVDSDLNDAPVVSVNDTLLVDDTTAQSLTGSLLATDTDNDAADLRYSVSQTPVHGALLLDGVELTDFSQPVFTQADIDNGRVSFQFHTPEAGDEIQVVETDSFIFRVSDGALSSGEATFVVRNTAVQVLGTDGGDDLTGAVDFDAVGASFHVYGFGGDDTLRGGSGADTLEGAAGLDTVDYGASDVGVNVDLTRVIQTGGQAEGDSLTGIENLVGSNFNDILTGDANHNRLDGGIGNDTLSSGAGNDTLIGGAGVDSMDGGTGTDMGDYSGSASWVQVDLALATAQVGGGADNQALGDTLAGIENLTGTTDTAHGDVLTGNTLANLLIGLDGNDTLLGGAGNDTLSGGGGADSLDGGAGTRDLADYSTSATWVNVDLNLATAQSGGGAGNHALGDTLVGIESVIGTNDTTHGDVLTGTGVSNWMSGLDGDDTINGGGFYDTIYGGNGNDVIDGGTHEDSIFGGAGNDTIYGGSGIDSIWGGSGDDYLEGYYSAGMDGNQDLLIGGTGNDTLDGSHSSAWDTLVGGMGADRIIGNGIRTEVSYELTGYGDFDVSYQGVYLDLNIQDGVTAQTGKPGGDDATGDILTGIVNAVGSNGSDTLIGNDQANEMYGVDADDLMIGGAGNDSLWGVNNNDTLEGGLGADFIWGGMDYDIASYANAASGVNVSLEIQLGPTQSGAGEENGDELWYMDGLWGSEFNDTLAGRNTDDPDYMSVHNLIEGRGGDDILAGLSGNDTLDGGTGTDTANYSLSSAAVNVDLTLATAQTGGEAGNHATGDVFVSIENVIGSAFNDTLIGNGEANVLSGMAGDDSLIGGGGEDTLIGGAGSDTFQGGDGGDLIRAGAGDVVDGGAGSDMLVSEDEYLDVTSSTTITGIERIDLTGVGKELTVGGDAILLNGVADPAGSGLMALVVNGDDGDSVVRLADGGWTWTLVAGDVTVGGDGLNYTLYEAAKAGQTVRLYIETGLNEIELADGVYQVLGTEGHDDLSTVWDFTDSRYPFNIQGLGGDDTLLGGPGADTLAGGAGSDLMDGGAGYDMASYSASPTWVNVDLNLQDGVTMQSGGGADNYATGDALIGFEGVIGSNDAVHGDVLTGDAQANMLVGLDGDDSLVGGVGNDTLVGGLGYDTLEGGDGDDWFQDGVGSYDNTYTGDSLVGGAGIDTVDYSNSLDVCMVDLTDSWYSFPNSPYSDAYCDTLVGIENIVGSQYFDSLLGDGAANLIRGEGGWDYILGRGGDDTLLGGSDNDTIDGGAGNDSIDGGTGNDLLIGGAGIDIIQGGTGDDLIHGGADDVVDGGDGFDTFRLEDNIGIGSTFDLSAMNDAGRITGIERIDITGDADDANTLTLRAEDVFEVSGASLYVDGDAGDSVTTIGAGWTQEAGDVSFGGETYHHYTSTYSSQTIDLYVDIAVTYQNT